MTKLSKRFIAFLTAAIMCLSLGLSVSAESINSPSGTFSTNSSISGYEQANLTKDKAAMLIYVDAEGIGGAGITVKTSCSAHYRIGLSVFSPDMSEAVCDNITFYTDSEVQFHDLIQMGGNPYVVILHDIPEGVTVFTQVWVYG